ncbi:ribosomal protein S6 kinase-related protein isoform X2 [Neopsephotus bourkii]|uniref:ribosomal protein S6 kinase-related protein isoform X2 n=1 Tax=Neopsephotus bourkii TaxID=309878 RepID=UPI002AA5B57E|nr:ribosomal protein S6 kinase-related protein isoform X2 [Neopsephotus bourkii]
MGASSSGPGPAPVRPPQGRAVGSWVRALLGRTRPVPGSGLALVPRGGTEEPPVPGWPLPQLVSLFLPEFPVRSSARQQQLKILGFVAKGSFGTILKVLDCGREKVCAVKVVPKVEVLRRDTLKQCKEEVSIQRQVRHPFVHGLGDSWQGQRHLFIMCTYCSTGDLHALWRAAGSFTEATVRLFAAELVLVLVYLHDLGIIHRDVKMENILLDERGHLKLTDFGLSRHLQWGERAHTICGTLQYMVPRGTGRGPCGHAGACQAEQLREPTRVQPRAGPADGRAAVPQPPAPPALPPSLPGTPLLPRRGLRRRPPAEGPGAGGGGPAAPGAAPAGPRHLR